MKWRESIFAPGLSLAWVLWDSSMVSTPASHQDNKLPSLDKRDSLHGITLTTPTGPWSMLPLNLRIELSWLSTMVLSTCGALMLPLPPFYFCKVLLDSQLLTELNLFKPKRCSEDNSSPSWLSWSSMSTIEKWIMESRMESRLWMLDNSTRPRPSISLLMLMSQRRESLWLMSLRMIWLKIIQSNNGQDKTITVNTVTVDIMDTTIKMETDIIDTIDNKMMKRMFQLKSSQWRSVNTIFTKSMLLDSGNMFKKRDMEDTQWSWLTKMAKRRKMTHHQQWNLSHSTHFISTAYLLPSMLFSSLNSLRNHWLSLSSFKEPRRNWLPEEKLKRMLRTAMSPHLSNPNPVSSPLTTQWCEYSKQDPDLHQDTPSKKMMWCNVPHIFRRYLSIIDC